MRNFIGEKLLDIVDLLIWLAEQVHKLWFFLQKNKLTEEERQRFYETYIEKY